MKANNCICEHLKGLCECSNTKDEKCDPSENYEKVGNNTKNDNEKNNQGTIKLNPFDIYLCMQNTKIIYNFIIYFFPIAIIKKFIIHNLKRKYYQYTIKIIFNFIKNIYCI